MRHLLPMIAGCLLAVVVVVPAGAREKPKAMSSEALWYERTEAYCKAEARRYYTVLHFKKRRLFVRRCINRAYR